MLHLAVIVVLASILRFCLAAPKYSSHPANTPRPKWASAYALERDARITPRALIPVVDQACGGRTMNVQDAGLYYWDPLKYTYTVSFGNIYESPVPTTVTGIVFSSNPAPFSITQGPLGAAATEILSYTPGINFTVPVSSTPTNTVTYTSIDSSGISTSTEIVPIYSISTLSSFTPTHVVAGDKNGGLTATFPTPYVYFTGFEIREAQITTVNGLAQCVTTTTSVPLPTPVWSAYAGDPHTDWAGKSQVSGPLPTDPPLSDMAKALGHSGFDGGTFMGVPTMRVAVLAEVAVPAAHTEQTDTESGLNIPTLPPGPILSAGLPSTSPPTTSNEQSSQVLIRSVHSEISITGFYITTTVPAMAISAGNQTTLPSSATTQETPGSVRSGVPMNGSDVTISSSASASSSAAQSPASTTQTSESSSASASSQPSVSSITPPTSAPPTIQQSPISSALPVMPSSNIALNSSSVSEQSVNSPAPGSPIPITILTIGSRTITANEVSSLAMNSTATLVPGGPAVTVSGTPVSLAASASAIIVAGSTAQLSPVPVTEVLLPPPVTIGTQVVTANSASAFLIGGQTLVPGGSALTVSGVPVSLASSASAIIVEGSTAALSPALALTVTGTLLPPSITVFNTIITANAASAFIIESQTLIPGGSALTIYGTPISLAPSASTIVIGSSEFPIQPSIARITPAPSITFGGSVITAGASSIFIVAGQTLVPGGSAITISGTVLSLAPSATNVVVGPKTVMVGASTVVVGPSTIMLGPKVPSTVYVTGTRPAESGLVSNGAQRISMSTLSLSWVVSLGVLVVCSWL